MAYNLGLQFIALSFILLIRWDNKLIRLLSNIGDYAWGRDGLDAIVTQLMNQMEGTGPPPLATDKIDTLPDVKISQEQVGKITNI